MLPHLVFTGTPLIPPEFVSAGFVLFLGLLLIIYSLLHLHLNPLHLNHKLQILLGTTIGLKIGFIVGGLIVGAYWLIPVPAVVATSPTNGYSNTTTRDKIEIHFSRPVSRQPIQKQIAPEAPGTWVFENPVYGTHLYYSLVFYPTFSLEPDTNYNISIENIRNLIQISEPIDYEFSFQTQPLPTIQNVTPSDQATNISVSGPIQVHLNQPNDHMSDLSFEITPDLDFDIVPDTTQQTYLLVPTKTLAQGQTYDLKIYQTPLQWDITSNQVFLRDDTQLIHESTFSTKSPPGIESITPNGTNTLINDSLTFSFSEPMDRASVETSLIIQPETSGSFTWTDETTFSFKPNTWEYNTDYKVILAQGTQTFDGGFLEQDIEHTFSTIGHVEMANVYPENGWQGVGVNSSIQITFDQAVNKSTAEEKFSIQPTVEGAFSWEENTLTFKPLESLSYSTSYQISFESGIVSINGLDSIETFSTSFTTQHQTTKLAITPHLQEHSLSCEVAALKMALAYRGHDISEATLINQMGFVDPYNKQGNVWGDPHEGFVGNIDGRQMVTGYGVYWGPIARVARNYREAQEFSGWTTTQITQTIADNNPVVIWAYSKGGVPTTWYTPEGKEIYAISGEHTFTVTGFVGPVDDPVQIILNDPLVGEIYWSRAFFESKWSSLGNSGVVVY